MPADEPILIIETCWMDALWLLQEHLETVIMSACLHPTGQVPEVENETVVLLNEACKQMHDRVMTILDQHLPFPMERFRDIFGTIVPHLMRIRHFIPATQHFLALVHQVLDRVDGVDLEPVLEQAIERVRVLIDKKRNCPLDETLFHELLRATFPTLVPETMPLEDVQMQVAESFEFQITADPITIPLGPLLNNRSVVITIGGLCFELFRTGNPDSRATLTMRWIHPGLERTSTQKTGGRIEGCTDESVGLAGRDLTRPAPVDRKGRRAKPDRNRLVSAARVAVELKAFFYRDNGARSRTTEEVLFPEHDLVLLPYRSSEMFC